MFQPTKWKQRKIYQAWMGDFFTAAPGIYFKMGTFTWCSEWVKIR